MAPPRKPDPIKYCTACGKLMQRKRFGDNLEDMKAFNRRKYCDQKCMAVGMTGKIKVANAKNSRRQSGRAVKEACETCGKNKGRLHVHHIDHNPLNNAPQNLMTLCGSCHRRIHSPNFAGTPTQRKQCKHCAKPAMQVGLCWTHLTRYKRYGDPLLKKIKIGSEWHLKLVDG